MTLLSPALQKDFPALFALLAESFPPDECRPYDAQRALLEDPRCCIYTARECRALLTIWRFDDFSFIEHFAVSPTLRNKGLGTVLLREALSFLPGPVILEAELPSTETAKHRLHFYRRNGFTVNPYPYIQPSYGPGRRPVEMAILSTEPLSHDHFQKVRNTLYCQVYHVTP